ncbi:TPA: hypothetical protein NGS41_004514 [Vibrio parahaemolyticus]|nr:hypothetical protein [Vibrio parahaemolyticus]
MATLIQELHLSYNHPGASNPTYYKIEIENGRHDSGQEQAALKFIEFAHEGGIKKYVMSELSKQECLTLANMLKTVADSMD